MVGDGGDGRCGTTAMFEKVVDLVAFAFVVAFNDTGSICELVFENAFQFFLFW